MKYYLTDDDVRILSTRLLNEIQEKHTGRLRVYCVPRGGVMAFHHFLLLREVAFHRGLTVKFSPVLDPCEADIIFDDIVDSGATRERLRDVNPRAPFYALVDKTRPQTAEEPYAGYWVVFPWEVDGDAAETVEDNVTRILQYIGEDVNRPGLAETPTRVAKAMDELYSGYGQDPQDFIKAFEDGGSDYDEMVVVRDIPFYSTCEHHMETIFGTANIGYIPDGRVLGLSKLSRLLDVFARRLQVQERLTVQVADALEQGLAPRGVAIQLQARHMCMERRGINKQGHSTVTCVLRGACREPAVRAEFFANCRQ